MLREGEDQEEGGGGCAMQKRSSPSIKHPSCILAQILELRQFYNSLLHQQQLILVLHTAFFHALQRCSYLPFDSKLDEEAIALDLYRVFWHVGEQ